MHPAHLTKEFLEIYDQLRIERLIDKKEGRTFEADWKKLVLNSTWGKTMNGFTLVSDMSVGLMITLTGQLMLLQLIEKLVKINVKVILSNTDSVVLVIKKKEREEVYKVIKEWETINDYELEETNYNKYFARDVNCYLGIDKKGKIKAKNDFNDEIDFHKGMDGLIISKAVKDYFLYDVPVQKTIKECTDINMFLITYKPGPGMKMNYTTIIDGLPVTKQIQKINRWYISKRFGKLFAHSKRKDKKSGLLIDSKTDKSANHYLKVLNDFAECPRNFKDFEINYDYYTNRALEFINKIEPIQTTLF